MNVLLKSSPETSPKIPTCKREIKTLKTKDPGHALPPRSIPTPSLSLLFPLHETTLCVAQDWGRRMSAPPPSPSSMEWRETRACQVLCSRLNRTSSRDGTATLVGMVLLGARLSALYNNFLHSISVNSHPHLRRKGLLFPSYKWTN